MIYPQPIFSIITPCFNEEDSLPLLVRELCPLLMRRIGPQWELLIVDDGSTDHTRQKIEELHSSDNRVKGIFLSRNFGHQAAILTGLNCASGQYVGVMDADLQDPPDVLLKCFDIARSERIDIVSAVRSRRDGTLLLKTCYWLFYRSMRFLADSPFEANTGDFCVLSHRAVELLTNLPERAFILRGMRSWIGLEQREVTYVRPRRVKGKSQYTFRKLVSLALESIVSFSSLPLLLPFLAGLMSLFGALFFGALAGAFWVWSGSERPWEEIPLWFCCVMGVNCLTASFLFVVLAIVGKYLATVLMEVKCRPRSIVVRHLGFTREGGFPFGCGDSRYLDRTISNFSNDYFSMENGVNHAESVTDPTSQNR